MKFEGANSNEDILEIISNLKNYTHKLVKQEVSLYSEKIAGAHSYEIKLFDDTLYNLPIW